MVRVWADAGGVIRAWAVAQVSVVVGMCVGVTVRVTVRVRVKVGVRVVGVGFAVGAGLEGGKCGVL